jgi:putative membrane protein
MVKGANELHANPVDAASANGVGIRPAKRSPVGFIGLGRMGTVMAANLSAAGYRLIAYVRRRDQMDKLAALGLTPTCRRERKITILGVLRMEKAGCLMFAFTALTFGTAIANAQTVDAPAAASASASQLSAVDDNFITLANLGAPFQIASGRLAEKKGTTAGIRDYAHLMVASHAPVVKALNAVPQRKNMTAPPNTLLHGPYDAMVAALQAERGTAFDRDYVDGQVEYQKGNAALFQYEIQNGADPDLKEFARQTLPKVEDHLHRALALAKGSDRKTAGRG